MSTVRIYPGYELWCGYENVYMILRGIPKMKERKMKASCAAVFLLSLVPVCDMMLYVMVKLYVIESSDKCCRNCTGLAFPKVVLCIMYCWV